MARIKFKLPDKLQKLIRLATNNPNEHEANLAARRVCKILFEQNMEFELNVPDTAQSAYGGARGPGKPVTWNDVTRSTEPAWRSRPQSPRPHEGNRTTYTENWFRQYASWAQGEPIVTENKDWEKIVDNLFGGKGKTVDATYKRWCGEKRKLICKTCKQEKETVFAGLPELFECNDCQWSAYTKSR